eukprot:UN24784
MSKIDIEIFQHVGIYHIIVASLWLFIIWLFEYKIKHANRSRKHWHYLLKNTITEGLENLKDFSYSDVVPVYITGKLKTLRGCVDERFKLKTQCLRLRRNANIYHHSKWNDELSDDKMDGSEYSIINDWPVGPPKTIETKPKLTLQDKELSSQIKLDHLNFEYTRLELTESWFKKYSGGSPHFHLVDNQVFSCEKSLDHPRKGDYSYWWDGVRTDDTEWTMLVAFYKNKFYPLRHEDLGDI